MVAALIGAADALATCPAPYNDPGDDCVVASGAVTVCSVVTDGSGAKTWQCDMDQSGSSATEGASVVIVEDYSALTHYEAWGTYNGEDFCCEQAYNSGGVELSYVRILGTPYVDTLRFSDQTYTYGLQRHSSGSQTLQGVIYGRDGGDTIAGSPRTSNYTDLRLDGENGNDVISGSDGNDYLYGGAGADTMFGGNGNDYMQGDGGGDEMCGMPGDDTMEGGGATDLMSGGPGNDTMSGGDGGDVICGDAGSGDVLADGPGDTVAEPVPDKLWGADLGDEATCYSGAGTDVDGSTTDLYTSCDAVLTSTRPTGCPCP